MTEPARGLPDDIISFKVVLKLDATITVESPRGTQDWVKPGAETGMKWGYVPDESALARAIIFMTHNVLEPTLSHVAETVLERERALRQEMSG